MYSASRAAPSITVQPVSGLGVGRSRPLAALALLFCVMLGRVALARADWTTYHEDAARDGVDVSSGAPVTFAPAWTSPTLGGAIYGEPLIYKGLVIVVTENNDIYGLSESTGQVVWHVNVGPAVPSSALPCGDISPTVGITSTPVIDTTSGTLYAVADVWNSAASSASHELWALNAQTGAPDGFPIAVDPPGTTPQDQLQRTALNLDEGYVLFGFGGNDGDCGTYWGWLVSVAESSRAISDWKVPVGNGGAIWATGGPTVDASGGVYVATGNSDQLSNPFDWSESVVKFSSPAGFPTTPSNYFAPSDWAALNGSDLDLGSSSPVLLPNNLVYQDGKDGNGLLLSSTKLGGIGGQLFDSPVCGSYGGDAFQGNAIYVACSSGVKALSLNPTKHSFSTLWSGPSDANGSPIVAGGLLWVPAYGDGRLYGLDTKSGAVVVNQPTPGMEHFTSPAASDGRLVLATGQTVEAYTIAQP
jgi:outer membrane protein assembly factor BamB